MKILSYLLMGIFLLSFASCGDDDSKNSTPLYKVEMTITGDLSLEYLSNIATFQTPNENVPNYLLSSVYVENDRTHTFAMTIDDSWIDKKEIDLTRDENRCTFAFDKGTATYTVIEGTFKVSVLTVKTMAGEVNFTAQKIGDPSKTIKVVNGKINVTKN